MTCKLIIIPKQGSSYFEQLSIFEQTNNQVPPGTVLYSL